MEGQLREASELIANTQYLFHKKFTSIQLELSENDTSDHDKILAKILWITTWDSSSWKALEDDITLSPIDRLKLFTFREWEKEQMKIILQQSKL